MQISSKTASILLFCAITSKLVQIARFNVLQICSQACRENIPMLCDNQNPTAGCDRPF